MKLVSLLLASCFLLLTSSTLFGAAGPVTLSEQQITIPTYLIGPPDPNPQFYFGGGSQGAQHRIYPYPAYDNLTTEKADKAYKIVYLENEYIKIGVLPESGGKIFEAIDKTNGYNFFYRQHVIKPALISLLGAWISGGVEWDVPHHHRATSFLPVQYTTSENPDGSKTIWVGELELRDRMRWAIGLTLHPGKSYLEASFRMINRTPVPVSMLCFSNVAVHVDDTYQVIFPPSTQHVTYHGKRSFTTWPIATTTFNNTDFSAGVDVSWYKAHYNSNSMFAWNYQDDFFAGYDHGKNAGTMSIADHNVVPGKKFWTWGKGPNGLLQDTLLTDSDGPYIELMVGAYSDNQPDYTWLAPYETRMWTQYWYPFRDIDGVKMANTDAAVNLEVKDDKARVGFYATSDRPAATVSLKLKDKVLLEEKIAINPGKPYTKEIALPAGVDEHDLRGPSLTAESKELVAYSPIKLQPEAMPSVVTNYPSPEQIKTNEELYLTGLRIDQFRVPGLAGSDPYWNEALKRDPGDIRVNTVLAINHIKGGRYSDAETSLRKALDRSTDRYTMPKDGEAFYYLGLALKAQGKVDEAFTQFSKATWSAAWKGAGYFEMAQIASMRSDDNAALAYADQALTANTANTRALGLKAAILRTLGRQSESERTIAQIAALDPLDIRIKFERIMVAIADYQRSHGDTKAFSAALEPLLAAIRLFPDACQEAAVDCVNSGRWNDACGFLSVIVNSGPNSSKISPMLTYTLAYCQQKSMEKLPPHVGTGPQLNTNEYYLPAAKASPDYAFPFQMEMIPVFEAAMAANPKDSRAPYYLGNLLFDSQPERAVALWKKSVDLGAYFPVVYRNLAMLYTRTGSPTYGITRADALDYLKLAAHYDGNAMIFADLDRLYEENGLAPERRLAILEENAAAINRDDVISRQITLDVFAGKYDQALALIKSRFFRAWEGGGRYSLGDSWVNANLLRGHGLLAAKKYPEALAAYQAALVFPTTLGEAIGSAANRQVEVNYFVGCAYEAMGDMDKARTAWRLAAGNAAEDAAQAGGGGRTGRGGGGRAGRGARGGRDGGRGGAQGGVAAGVSVPQALNYYQGLALQKLGETERAKGLFQQILEAGRQGLAGEAEPVLLAQRIRVADAHYLTGLGHAGLGDAAKARQEFTAALQAAPDHLAAKVALSAVK